MVDMLLYVIQCVYSDVNHACCKNCKIEKDKLCSHGGLGFCQEDSHCEYPFVYVRVIIERPEYNS